MKTSRLNPKKIIAKHRQQTMEYYNGWCEAEKEKEKKNKLFHHSVDRLVDVSKKKQKPKIIEKRIEVPVEVVKEVPVEVIREVLVEVIREKEKRVEVPVEVIKEVEVVKEIPVEVIKEVEVPVVKIKELEVIKEIPFEIEVEVPIIDEKAMKAVHKNYQNKLDISRIAKESLEERYKVALQQKDDELLMMGECEEAQLKKYKRLFTYAYVMTLYSLPQILSMMIF